MAVFRHLPKRNRGLGLAFGVHFLHDFSTKCPYQWTKFQCHTCCPSQDIKQNMLLRSYLDSR